PATRFVILTMHEEPALADAALRAGAMAYVVKQSAASELRVAIDEAIAGRKYLTPIMKSLGAGGTAALEAREGFALSPRQRSVLGLLRMGHSSRAIGEAMGLSRKTVDYHIEVMCRHLGIRGRTQLIRWSETHFREGE